VNVIIGRDLPLGYFVGEPHKVCLVEATPADKLREYDSTLTQPYCEIAGNIAPLRIADPVGESVFDRLPIYLAYKVETGGEPRRDT
jgi:hypothetical protein